VNDLYHYKKEDMIRDAETYLTNLPTITEKYRKMKHHRERIKSSASYFNNEFEEEYGLRLIKLDEKKVEYLNN
jgi:hypothetical protein